MLWFTCSCLVSITGLRVPEGMAWVSQLSFHPTPLEIEMSGTHPISR